MTFTISPDRYHYVLHTAESQQIYLCCLGFRLITRYRAHASRLQLTIRTTPKRGYRVAWLRHYKRNVWAIQRPPHREGFGAAAGEWLETLFPKVIVHDSIKLWFSVRKLS